MHPALPFVGWRLRYRTSDLSVGWPRRCAGELRDALPGAEILVMPDPDDDAMTITPPDNRPTALVNAARSAACRAVEKAHQAHLP